MDKYNAQEPRTVNTIKVPMTRNFTPKVYGCIVKIIENDLIISFIEFW
jgi:hypothetical protein